MDDAAYFQQEEPVGPFDDDEGIQIHDEVALNGGSVTIWRNRGIVDLMIADEDGEELGAVSVSADALEDALRRLGALR